jgi:hypothetical protein
MTAPAEHERRRRLVEAYRAGIPTDAEIERARFRFERRVAPRARPLSRVWALGLAQGFTVGLVTLAAASFVGATVLPRLSFFGGAAHEVTARPLPVTHEREPRGARREEPARAEPPAAAQGEAPAVEPASDGVTVSEEPSRELAPRPASPRSPAAAAQGTDAAVTDFREALPGTEGPWARVAQALAIRDFERADEALRALAESPDVTTRDAASLSRAEIWIARGSGAAVAGTVQRLAQSGNTPYIRRRATELLARLPR